ncbi:penicillin-binding transpeptidase domain-containing protein [Corallococcus sp. BB11-1]|uniref:penicillin-binding transpeptidase domain-containing protein n=1 Tax=Corallococcus sp. BB11-1 TaxID=2996783 RepID=UPI00226D61CD|nr:penicillin-binding transpeptidase domain-containing protein [Corallococcus sp. BB11-1]MCY1036704.1 penicillin-binding transpeptidase domain-containing protein [Corallococcus sp. BB11-1]
MRYTGRVHGRAVITWVGLCLLLLLPSCSPRVVKKGAPGGPEEVALAYLDAWARNDLVAQRQLLVQVPADFDAQHARWRQGLGVAASRFEGLDLEAQDNGTAVVVFRGVHTLRGLGDWEVESRLRFERQGSRWRLRWTPEVFHPEALAGDGFGRLRAWGPRAALLDASGAPLTEPGEVITVGAYPGRVRDGAAVASALQSQLGLDPLRVQAALRAANAQPEQFLAFIDVRPERYQQVRPALAPVPGIFFRKKTARLTPAEGFAAHTLGRVGEVTAEALKALGHPYQAGDVVGLSGLERAQERTLAGSPSGEVRLLPRSGEAVVLHRFEGAPGTPVRTTLRRDVQAAAEAALADVTRPAALVAVNSATGEVLAVASRPLGEALHRALTGRYPPGSTFKVVTAEALLAHGLKPDSRVDCPPEAIAGRRRFRNFEAEAFGQTTFRQVFALSCNTAFIQLSARLGRDALEDAARRFGFGVRYDVGLPSPGASFPAPGGAEDRAAASMGQGRVLATPLHMATVAAAVDTGVWHAPRLLADADAGPEARLSAGTPEALRSLMRAVVTEGSAKSAASFQGLMGKTGTAEFGTALPPETHAWFIGLRGGMGFVVFVEGGGVGGRVAVPIAARFLQTLDASAR